MTLRIPLGGTCDIFSDVVCCMICNFYIVYIYTHTIYNICIYHVCIYIYTRVVYAYIYIYIYICAFVRIFAYTNVQWE